MIRFYFHPTPNPAKVSLFLEEAHLPYEVVPIDTSKGQQHLAPFREINPNCKVPAIVDTEGPGGKTVRVFDSSAILLYLAHKPASFLERQKISRNCCPGYSSSHPGLVPSRVRRCTSSSSHPKARIMLATVIGGKQSVIIKSSKTIWPAAPLSWAIPTRSSTCPSGVGSTERPAS
jgi:Glutathione S-transferase, N-terminal domain